MGFSAAFLLGAGVLLLGFAIRPAMLEAVQEALRDLTVAVFGTHPAFEDPLSKTERLMLASMGATLIFLSGAAMA